MYRLSLLSISLLLIALCVCFQSFAAESYKGPIGLVVTKDGKTLYVINKDSCEIAVLDNADDKGNLITPFLRIVSFSPNAAALSNDEKILYIVGGNSNGRVMGFDFEKPTDDMQTSPAGHTPSAVVLSPDGKTLFVCNRFTNDVGEYSLPDLTLKRTIKVVREPQSAVITKDGKYLLVANTIPLMPTNYPEDEHKEIYVAAEISCINTDSGEVKSIKLPNGSGSLMGMCISPDGRYVYVTEVNARFLLPTTQVERGWMNTAGIAVIDTTKLEEENGGYVNTVLIDDVDKGAANPYGITTSADGSTIYVAVAGTDEFIIVDAVEMHKKLDADAKEKQSSTGYRVEVLDNLAFMASLKSRVKLSGKGARSITLAGNNVYIGMYYSDTIQKYMIPQSGEVSLRPIELALGDKPIWTPERRGEIYWNDATLCQQQWQSCASCHPDARMDGYNWDLMNDGMGNPKNAKSLLYSHKTVPTMWQGVRDNPHPLDPVDAWNTETQGIQCVRTGFKWILFKESPEEVYSDIDAYLRAEKPIPSPYLVDGKLSAKALRGKKIFEDTKIGCATCHPAPLYIDQKMHDVNTRCYYDTVSSFDTPTLIEVWRTAPYLHDGRYTDMKDVFKLGQHGDVAGDVGSLTDEQIDELVEYIMSL